nr:BTAD domain-containing putative transcriptional regulator [Kibdelosporangium sp. MJ126-NF4]CEL18561.1 Signal transduction response regulator / Disease resistance domain-containing protein / Tetratricopeptide repeat-containing protein [Kibdelosporangium sp. MJ126-NF4]CTQ98045.1 Signal transduction response regulator / Disease resistance domain-containing protein / Tetratricopeptide repeat-containing protein [Kibdelosporangium sp. MJ126-NF4]
MPTDLVLLSRVAYLGREVTGPRMRDLLAVLAADLRTGCSSSRLVRELWWDEQPANAAKALQILVSRTRSQLGSGLISSTANGYRLALTESQVDASAVLLAGSASAQLLRDGDTAAAFDTAETGLAHWTDAEPGEHEPADPLSVLRAERMITYRSLVRTRALALSRLGDHAAAVGLLAEVFRDRPQDEEVLLELLRCEASTAGASVALTRYDTYRRSLRDELGTDPGHALQEMHLQLLNGSAPVVRSGVPHEPNALLGRDDDIVAVNRMMRSSRVTSIVGPGGLGKTRLAHTVSRQAEQHAVHLVALAGITSDDAVAGAVASALGVGDIHLSPLGMSAPPPDLLAGIVGALSHGPALLVLDNCEHVVRGVADLVHSLVSMTSDLRILTTSRAPLGLSSESVYLLPELSLPASVELFNHRAKASRPTVALDVDAVQRVCRELEGLPLAIELAAARVRVMSVPDIAARLTDRFGLLRGGPRDAPERHRALWAVIDWSWTLLDASGQAAMRTLSVFPDGFTAEAAAHVLGTGDAWEVLTQLTDQSLLKVADTPAGARLHMLETVREFSAAQRDAAETEEVGRQFVAWARDFGVTHHDSLFGEDLVPVARRIRAEQDNLLLALRHGLDRADGLAVTAIGAVLGCLWLVESNFARSTWLTEQTEQLLSRVRPEPEHVEVTRTAAVLATVNTFFMQGPRATRSLAVLRRLPLGAPDTVMRAAHTMLLAPTPLSTYDDQAPLLTWMASAVESFQRQHDSDLAGALAAAERMLAAATTLGGPLVRVFAHARIGELCLETDQGDRARRHLAFPLPIMSELGAPSSMVRVRWSLSMANLQAGDLDQAERWAEDAAVPGDDAIGLGLRAEVMLGRGQTEAGLRTWRWVADRLMPAEDPVLGIDRSLQEWWLLEAQSVTVVAHARYGRLDVVRDIATALPATLTDILTTRPSTLNFPVYGSMLLAIAAADIADGRPGAGMVALAERFRFSRGYQPTMSPASARDMAEQADKAAYADARSTYAALDSDSLLAAALAALQTRLATRDHA